MPHLRSSFLIYLLLCSGVLAAEKWHCIENEHLRLGVNLDAGGCLGWFSRSNSSENVLNTYDAGRYVQQSYYGDADGSDWNGKPWRYNPVQGGSWKNQLSEVLHTEHTKTSLYTKTLPRHWASGAETPECIMEQWLRVEGEQAYLKYRLTYQGEKSHAPRHQELPAVFVMPRYETLVYMNEQKNLTQYQPGFPNEYLKLSEPWCAWKDEKTGEVIGIRFPHTLQVTCYRVRNGNKADCSYIAPIQTFALKPGLVFEYEVTLALGNLEHVRAVFSKLK